VCKTQLFDPNGMQRPAPGDTAICLHCSTWLRLNGDLTMRLLTQSDLDLLDDGTRKILTRLGRLCHAITRNERLEPSACH
jgi:hypothetical protein